jgi:hypothetical protein
MPDSELFSGAESLRKSHDVNLIRRLEWRALATASKLHDVPNNGDCYLAGAFVIARAYWRLLRANSKSGL